MFSSLHVERIVYVAGIIDVVSGDVIVSRAEEMPLGNTSAKLFAFFQYHPNVCGVDQRMSGNECGIFFLRLLFVKNTVGFLPQANAPDAVRTASAVEKADAVGAAFTLLAVEQTVTSHAVDALVAQLGLMEIEVVEGIFRAPDDMPIPAVLVVHAPKHHIAVLASEREVRIVAVFALVVHEVELRYGKQEFAELLEKRAIEVEWAPVFFCIPVVSPPFVVRVDLIGRCRGVHGKHRCA